MAKPRVYVETTIPSFYHEERTAPDIVARREWTRQWWNDAAERYELATSPAVLDELASGPAERSQKWLDLVRGLPLLPVEAGIAEIVQAYIRHRVMPTDPAGDALHLALASYQQVRFPGNLELPAPGEREQDRAHSPREYDAGTVCARTGNAP